MEANKRSTCQSIIVVSKMFDAQLRGNRGVTARQIEDKSRDDGRHEHHAGDAAVLLNAQFPWSDPGPITPSTSGTSNALGRSNNHPTTDK